MNTLERKREIDSKIFQYSMNCCPPSIIEVSESFELQKCDIFLNYCKEITKGLARMIT